MAREKGMGNLQREKSGRWTLRVCINGKRMSRSMRTTDRAVAERIAERFLAPLGLGNRRLPLADVWNSYVKSPNRNDIAPSTLKAKRLVWMHFSSWMERNYLPISDLAGVTEEAVSEYLATIRTELCATTYNNRVCVLREIFRVLATNAGIKDDVWARVRLRIEDSHSRRELTKDELKRLLRASSSVRQGTSASKHQAMRPIGQFILSEWRALFLVGIYTGLRLGDCCTLRWESIDLCRSIIQIVPHKTSRRRHALPVTIPMHPTLRAVIAESHAVQRVTHSSFLLPTLAEWYLHSRWKISEGLSRIFADAKITTSVYVEGHHNKAPEATFHSLRHTFVSFAANAGVPLHVVQTIVGHESTAMTRHYYHENLDALKSAIMAIPIL